MKPVVGMMFKNMLDGIQFYRVYAARCGFDIRFSTVRKSKDGIITWKYILCNRTGEKNTAIDFDATVDGVMDKRHAQIMIDNLFKRRELCSAFYFEYLVDGKNQLRHIFWADPICRRNFTAFGDSVSFDATYNTNRYKMVFTPFTGKDNHGKCVTFGVTLLSKPAVFEKKWQEIMSEYGLSDIPWFNSMYNLRYNWIPAYFRNHSLSGLCRTTSISESANSFYGSFVNSNCNLGEFFMKYDSAIDAQRYAYAEMNSVDKSTIISLQTPILFEKHVAVVYTTNIFVKVQKEIYSACFKCHIMSITESERQLFYNGNDGKWIFQVVYDSVEDTVVCSCAKFVREGLLCCHIYILLKDLNVDRILNKYVVPRWTRSCFDSMNECLTDLVISCAAVDENKMKINTYISEFYACIGVADGDDENLSALLLCVRDFNEYLKHDCSEEGIQSEKSKIFYNFCGCSRPTQVDVLPPDIVKTKGSGSRLIPRVEKAVREKKKPLRTCKKCNKKSRHDSRNCGKVND
ncbi:hypothetical protein C2S52_015609 [Perilla frutescens var. hirtella]|nr:hypothetical protein C2S52_015609 [Perilla frutescens var. hirtella]